MSELIDAVWTILAFFVRAYLSLCGLMLLAFVMLGLVGAGLPEVVVCELTLALPLVWLARNVWLGYHGRH